MGNILQRLIFIGVLALSLSRVDVAFAQLTDNEATDSSNAPRAVIYVVNRLGDDFISHIPVFEDLLVSQVTGLGFRIISVGDTVSSLASLQDPENPDALDELLASSTSASRLAQSVGADVLIVASLTSFGSNQQHLVREDLDINRIVMDYELIATYKFVDPQYGDAFSSGSVNASQRVQQSETLREQRAVIQPLLAAAAQKIAAKIELSGGVAELEKLATPSDEVATFYLSCSLQDMTVPEVTVGDDGGLILTGNRYKMEALAVTVELDGMVIGSAPGEFSAVPGIHRLRLSREGFETWERMINVRDGQTLKVALIMSESGRQKWFEMAEFFAGLKQQERMSQADEEVVRGFAELMRNSGIKVDVSVDESFW